MISATTKFKNAMTSGQLYEVVEITYADGSTQTIDTEIMRGDNSITDGASAGTFPVGVAIEKYMSLTLDNRNEQFSNKTFMNAKLEVYVKTPDSSIGRVKKGTFYVTSPESYGEVIKLTAVDLMYKADKPFSTDLVFPQTAQALLTNVCGKCGIPLGTISMTNGNLQIDKKPENMTYRGVIGNLAMIEGANARIDRNGYLQFVKWNFGTPTDLKDFLSSPTVSAEDIVVTGVKVTNSLYNYTAFYNNKVDDSYVITYENELIGNKVSTVAQTIGKAILGKHFRSMSGDISSNPLIEFGDMAKTYKYIPSLGEERSFLTPITDVKFSLQGRTTVSTTAEDPVRTGQSYTSQSVKTAVAQAAALVNAEKTAREEAVSNLAQQIKQNNGTYLTKEEQEAGGAVYYLHDAPTIADSEIIWKLTADALAVSTDGGQSYPYGITVNGDIIANLLYTHGIDATYINSGILTIRDPETNEVTFQADAGTGEVDIVANSFTLKGKSLKEVTENAIIDHTEEENLLLTPDFPENPPVQYWVTSGTITRGIADPLGGSDALKLEAGDTEGFLAAHEVNNPVYTETGTYKASVWLKADAAFTTKLALNREFQSVPITTEWKKYTITQNVTDVTSGQKFIIGGSNGIPANTTIYVYNPIVSKVIEETEEEVEDLSDFENGSNLVKGWKMSALDVSKYWNIAGAKVNRNKTDTSPYLDPFGGYGALLVKKDTASTSNFILRAKKDTNAVIYMTGHYQLSIWMRANIAYNAILRFNGKNYTCALTSTWQEFKFNIDVDEISTADNYNFAINLSNASDTTNTYIYRPKVQTYMTSEEIFNVLTNNGETQGIYMQDGKIYINASYIGSGTINANRIGAKAITADKLSVDDLQALGATIGGFKVGKTYIACTDTGDDSTALRRVMIATYGNSSNHNAIIVQTRATTGGSWKNSIQINYDGKVTFKETADWDEDTHGSGVIKPQLVIGNDEFTAANMDFKVNYNSDYSNTTTIANYMHIPYRGNANVCFSGGGYFLGFMRNRPRISCGTATSGAYLGTKDGEICTRSSSSRRYKNIFENMTAEEVEKFFDLPVRWASYKDDYIMEEDERYRKQMPMFIAEEIEEIMPIAVDHMNGQAETWNDRIMIPVMFQMIKSLKSDIKKLQDELAELKSTNN